MQAMIPRPTEVEAAIWLMEREGYGVCWLTGEPHIITAVEEDLSEIWSVMGDDPLAAVTELMEQVGFEVDE